LQACRITLESIIQVIHSAVSRLWILLRDDKQWRIATIASISHQIASEFIHVRKMPVHTRQHFEIRTGMKLVEVLTKCRPV